MKQHKDKKTVYKFSASKVKKLALIMLCTSALTACQSTAQKKTEMDETLAIDNALKQAAITAAMQGEKEKSLALVERLYRRNSEDPKLAMLYAQALRKEDRLTRAALVIQPHVMSGLVPEELISPVYTEYAAILAAMGDYKQAEFYARQAVIKAPELGRPYHILGLALDAQGHHPEAEIALRKAIDRWQGDPTPVLNNLGLNLAAQGFLDQAVETLRKAKAAAPNRDEIERNLRIVSALHATPPKGWSFMPKAVMPLRKPPVVRSDMVPEAPSLDLPPHIENHEPVKPEDMEKQTSPDAESTRADKTALPTRKPAQSFSEPAVSITPVTENDVEAVPAVAPNDTAPAPRKTPTRSRSFND